MLLCLRDDSCLVVMSTSDGREDDLLRPKDRRRGVSEHETSRCRRRPRLLSSSSPIPLPFAAQRLFQTPNQQLLLLLPNKQMHHTMTTGIL